MKPWLFAVAAIIFARILLAQEPIRVTTRLIETSVIVRDKNGPVADLTLNDFKIFDNRTEQKVAVFRVSKREANSLRQVMLPANVFSNRALRRAPAQRRIVLLIDALNTDPLHQGYVKAQLLAMLDSMEVKDPIAIDVLGQEFRVLQDFTMDADLLKKGVQAFRPESSAKLRMATDPTPYMPDNGSPTRAMIQQNYNRMRAFGNRDRALATVDILAALGKQLAPLPGKKSVVWISDAFPLAVLNHDLESVQALNRADVAIYGVDARGLVPPLTGVPDYPQTLQWFADETGGRAFYNRNDFSIEIQEAINDTDVTYTLGFYATREKPDGNFHSLKVEVNRSGVDVRSRKGYFDIETKPADLTSINPATVPENASDVGLVAAIARSGANYQIAVLIGFSDLHLTQEKNRWKGSAKLMLIAQSADGRAVDVKSKTLTFDMTGDAYLQHQREGVAVEQMIPANAKVAKIRVVILDRWGASGEVSITPRK